MRKNAKQTPQIQFRSVYIETELAKRVWAHKCLSQKAKLFIETFLQALSLEHGELRRLFSKQEIAQVGEISEPDFTLLWAQMQDLGATSELVERIRALRPLQRIALIDLAHHI